jgi:4-nitrophenyl phosphatase
MMQLSSLKAFIIDMDGVLWQGNQAFDGIENFFSTLRDKNIKFVLATNNASHTRKQYVAKLRSMNVLIAEEEIITSGTATAHYLSQTNDAASTRVYVIGEDGAREPLRELGFTLTEEYELTDQLKHTHGAEIVVCGKDHAIACDKLATATLNINAGALFIGTNADTSLPTERGVIHGNGAILAALHTATRVQPVIIGKPEPFIYQQALSLLGTTIDETIAIGDRLETDILGAVRTGMRSILVLSGIATHAEVIGSAYQPTWIMQDIQAITNAIRLLPTVK